MAVLCSLLVCLFFHVFLVIFTVQINQRNILSRSLLTYSLLSVRTFYSLIMSNELSSVFALRTALAVNLAVTVLHPM